MRSLSAVYLHRNHRSGYLTVPCPCSNRRNTLSRPGSIESVVPPEQGGTAGPYAWRRVWRYKILLLIQRAHIDRRRLPSPGGHLQVKKSTGDVRQYGVLLRCQSHYLRRGDGGLGDKNSIPLRMHCGSQPWPHRQWSGCDHPILGTNFRISELWMQPSAWYQLKLDFILEKQRNLHKGVRMPWQRSGDQLQALHFGRLGNGPFFFLPDEVSARRKQQGVSRWEQALTGVFTGMITTGIISGVSILKKVEFIAAFSSAFWITAGLRKVKFSQSGIG
jgi:hypothetical protein